MKKLQKKTAMGFVYSILERAGVQCFNFFLSILLARLLSPEEYGSISLVIVFISICDVFVTYGFGNSLVVQKDSDEVDFSTCFYFGIFLALCIYVIVFFSAPSIASYYDVEIMVPVLHVMGLRIPIAAINSVQQAYLSKKMEFKVFLHSSIVGTILSGIAAVIMAYCNCGVWSLVVQYLGTAAISTLYLWFVGQWRPILAFSWHKLKRIYQYGWKILVVGLIDTGYTELRNLVIAKRYTTSDLAFYSKGNNFPALCMKLVEPSISKVLFASLSHCNDDKEEMRKITRKFTEAVTYIVFPLLIGLAVIAKPLITVLLTEKWLPAAIYLQICCVGYIFRPTRVISNCVTKASGRSDLLLKLDIAKKLIGITVLLFSIQFGVVGIAISLVISNALATVINLFSTRYLIDYAVSSQLLDTFKNLIISLLMGAVVYLISLLPIPTLVLLLCQVAVGVLAYLVLSVLTRNPSFFMVLSFVKKFLRKRSH